MEDFDNIKLMSKRPNIATLTGLRFDYLDPTVGMVNIVDLVEGMSKDCRFAGQCSGWYSVARHSVRVSLRVEKVARNEMNVRESEVIELALKALFHDAPEAYTKDAPSPWKKLFREIWKPIEIRLTRVIYQAMGIEVPIGLDIDPIDAVIHRADEFIYLCEWHDIMNTEKIKDWYYPGERPSYNDEPMTVNYATWEEDRRYFMGRYNELVARREALSRTRRA
jgi:hypothetical protein